MGRRRVKAGRSGVSHFSNYQPPTSQLFDLVRNELSSARKTTFDEESVTPDSLHFSSLLSPSSVTSRTRHAAAMLRDFVNDSAVVRLEAARSLATQSKQRRLGRTRLSQHLQYTPCNIYGNRPKIEGSYENIICSSTDFSEAVVPSRLATLQRTAKQFSSGTVFSEPQIKLHRSKDQKQYFTRLLDVTTLPQPPCEQSVSNPVRKRDSSISGIISLETTDPRHRSKLQSLLNLYKMKDSQLKILSANLAKKSNELLNLKKRLPEDRQIEISRLQQQMLLAIANKFGLEVLADIAESVGMTPRHIQRLLDIQIDRSSTARDSFQLANNEKSKVIEQPLTVKPRQQTTNNNKPSSSKRFVKLPRLNQSSSKRTIHDHVILKNCHPNQLLLLNNSLENMHPSSEQPRDAPSKGLCLAQRKTKFSASQHGDCQLLNGSEVLAVMKKHKVAQCVSEASSTERNPKRQDIDSLKPSRKKNNLPLGNRELGDTPRKLIGPMISLNSEKLRDSSISPVSLDSQIVNASSDRIGFSLTTSRNVCGTGHPITTTNEECEQFTETMGIKIETNPSLYQEVDKHNPVICLSNKPIPPSSPRVQHNGETSHRLTYVPNRIASTPILAENMQQPQLLFCLQVPTVSTPLYHFRTASDSTPIIPNSSIYESNIPPSGSAASPSLDCLSCQPKELMLTPKAPNTIVSPSKLQLLSQSHPMSLSSFQHIGGSACSRNRNISSISELSLLPADPKPEIRIRSKPSTCDGIPNPTSLSQLGQLSPLKEFRCSQSLNKSCPLSKKPSKSLVFDNTFSLEPKHQLRKCFSTQNLLKLLNTPNQTTAKIWNSSAVVAPKAPQEPERNMKKPKASQEPEPNMKKPKAPQQPEPNMKKPKAPLLSQLLPLQGSLCSSKTLIHVSSDKQEKKQKQSETQAARDKEDSKFKKESIDTVKTDMDKNIRTGHERNKNSQTSEQCRLKEVDNRMKAVIYQTECLPILPDNFANSSNSNENECLKDTSKRTSSDKVIQNKIEDVLFHSRATELKKRENLQSLNFRICSEADRNSVNQNRYFNVHNHSLCSFQVTDFQKETDLITSINQKHRILEGHILETGETQRVLPHVLSQRNHGCASTITSFNTATEDLEPSSRRNITLKTESVGNDTHRHGEQPLALLRNSFELNTSGSATILNTHPNEMVYQTHYLDSGSTVHVSKQTSSELTI